MDIQPLTGALGAEIRGFDLRQAPSNEQASAIYDAFLEHKVVFFRDQDITPQQHLRLARIFGEPGIYPFIEGLPETPEVIEILKTEQDTINFGGSWHSDTAYLAEPALGTVLYAHEVPEFGGDTQFANTALAFDALSDGMQETLSHLIGVNYSDRGYKGGRAAGMARMSGMKDKTVPQAQTHTSEHPIVRTHPDTGNKSLYLSRSHTYHFKDMTEEESQPLIHYLSAHMQKPEFICRFQWAPGSIAVWDNRTTMHYALNDYQGKRRRMHRVTLKGDRPR